MKMSNMQIQLGLIGLLAIVFAVFVFKNYDFFTGSPVITVVSASYGKNCKPTLAGNLTNTISALCNGNTTSTFNFTWGAFERIGDPAPGCSKQFEVQYTCSGSNTMKTFSSSVTDTTLVNGTRVPSNPLSVTLDCTPTPPTPLPVPVPVPTPTPLPVYPVMHREECLSMDEVQSVRNLLKKRPNEFTRPQKYAGKDEDEDEEEETDSMLKPGISSCKKYYNCNKKKDEEKDYEEQC